MSSLCLLILVAFLLRDGIAGKMVPEFACASRVVCDRVGVAFLLSEPCSHSDEISLAGADEDPSLTAPVKGALR